jgi:hypothetical protein
MVVLFRITKLLHIKKYVLELDNRTVTYFKFFISLIKDYLDNQTVTYVEN